MRLIFWSCFGIFVHHLGQGCILAVGAGVKQFVYPTYSEVETALVRGEELDTAGPKVATMMNLTLSSDARCVDQASASQFMQALKQYLDNPKQLML